MSMNKTKLMDSCLIETIYKVENNEGFIYIKRARPETLLSEYTLHYWNDLLQKGNYIQRKYDSDQIAISELLKEVAQNE